jgi:putative oxidoreductase
MPLIFVIGRVLLGGFFLYNAYNHFKSLSSYSGYAASKGVPAPKIAVGFSGVLLLVAGVSIVLGVFTGVGIAAAVLFLIPVTFQMHAFWNESDPSKQAADRIQFGKNIAILGAVLMLLSLSTPWMNSL